MRTSILNHFRAAPLIVAMLTLMLGLSPAAAGRLVGTWTGRAKGYRVMPLEIVLCNTVLAGPVRLQVAGEDPRGILTGQLTFEDDGLSSPISGWLRGTRTRITATYVFYAPNGPVPSGSVQGKLVATVEGTVEGDVMEGSLSESIDTCGPPPFVTPISLKRVAESAPGADRRPGSPVIASITPIVAQPFQTITITGSGFGSHRGFSNEDTPYLAIRDKTAGWAAGRATPSNFDLVTLSVARWTDTEIVVTGFGGAYGRGWQLRDGDQVEVAVWNAQTGEGPAIYELTAGNPERHPVRLSNTQSAQSAKPFVTSRMQCVGPGDARAQNKPPGTVQVVSGTGAFVGVSPGHKAIEVNEGSNLTGTVVLRVLNLGPGFALAPLIMTPSWGDHASSWRLVGYLLPGDATITAQLNTQAPRAAALYHIFFAFGLETGGGDVASGTSWTRHQDVWNDGNDVAQLGSSEILEAQRFGCVIHRWLADNGSEMIYLPADAITVIVRAPAAVNRAPSDR